MSDVQSSAEASTLVTHPYSATASRLHPARAEKRETRRPPARREDMRTVRRGCIGFLFTLGAVGEARAFVPSPVGGHPGEVDANARVTLERGKVEPNENPDSKQHARWNVYQLGAGYTIGSIGPLQDVRFGIDAAYFYAPAEVNDLSLGAPVPASKCGGIVVGSGLCQFHITNNGYLVTPRASANLIHDARLSFGAYLQGTAPFDINLRGFVVPRVDILAGGVTFGAHLTDWASIETNTYLGLGVPDKQNGAVAQTVLFGLEARKWLLPWPAGIKVGPYFEGDITERFDDRYDAAYTAGYPDRRNRIQALKFAVAFLPYVRITDRFALELGYVQKFFGYDPPATQTYYIGARAAF
jgi:hypothetical protein